jgi:hypothetical protein
MSIITNAVQPTVLGQPLNPNFGVVSGGPIPASMNPIVNPVPLAANIGGTNKTILEACARGELPRNAQLASISGVAVSAGISQSQGDGLSVDEGMSGGNGAEMCLGVAVPPNAANPNSITTVGINNQTFVDGTATSNDSLSTGPTPTNNESVISAPTPGSTTVNNVSLVANSYAG